MQPFRAKGTYRWVEKIVPEDQIHQETKFIKHERKCVIIVLERDESNFLCADVDSGEFLSVNAGHLHRDFTFGGLI